MARPTRRQAIAATAAALLLGGPGVAAASRQGDAVVDVGIFRLALPPPVEPVTPSTGWSWAGRTSGALVQVVGDLRAPTPELAAAAVLGSSAGGRMPLAVTGHPAQTVRGATDYLVWQVEQRVGEDLTGALLAAGDGTRSGVALVLGEAGWSPGLRRTILAGIEVVRR